MARYTAFGLTFSSALELSELLPATDAVADITIEFGSVPESLAEPSAAFGWIQVNPRQFLLCVLDTARYLVTGGNSIVIERVPGAPDSQVRLFILGSVMGALLHQRGALPLHSSGIATPRGAVLFCGPSGRGKSTLAYEFQRRGYPHLCDDIALVRLNPAHIPLVYAGYPQMNLWADTLERQGQHSAELQALRPNLSKYAVSTRSAFHTSPMPLYAIYELQLGDADTIELVPQHDLGKLQLLTRNTYHSRLMDPMGTRATLFQMTAVVGQSIRAARIIRPAHIFRLTELADRLEQDLDL